jgi:hypothetical protein
VIEEDGSEAASALLLEEPLVAPICYSWNVPTFFGPRRGAASDAGQRRTALAAIQAAPVESSSALPWQNERHLSPPTKPSPNQLPGMAFTTAVKLSGSCPQNLPASGRRPFRPSDKFDCHRRRRASIGLIIRATALAVGSNLCSKLSRFPANSAFSGVPCDVATRPVEARDEAGLHRVNAEIEDDGDRRGCRLGR